MIMAFDGRLSFWRTIDDVCHVMLARLSYLLASCPPTQLFLNIDCSMKDLLCHMYHLMGHGPVIFPEKVWLWCRLPWLMCIPDSGAWDA